jgi:hypothetical protein
LIVFEEEGRIEDEKEKGHAGRAREGGREYASEGYLAVGVGGS